MSGGKRGVVICNTKIIFFTYIEYVLFFCNFANIYIQTITKSNKMDINIFTPRFEM